MFNINSVESKVALSFMMSLLQKLVHKGRKKKINETYDRIFKGNA